MVTMGAMTARSNAADLRVRWQIKLGSIADTTPLVVGNTLYITTTDGMTYAVDTARAGESCGAL